MADRYVLEPERSILSVEASSTLHPIRSDATGVSGWVELRIGPDGLPDLSRRPAAHVEFELARLRSGNPLLDRETGRRVSADRHPVVTADLDDLEATDHPRRYRATGMVRFHGHEQRLTGFVDVDQTDHGVELNAWCRFDVRDFDVKPPRLLALRVHPEVEVMLHAHAVREEAGSPRDDPGTARVGRRGQA